MSVQDVVARVSREAFIPADIFVRDEVGWLVPLNRDAEPERWREQVEGDAAIVIRAELDPDMPAEACDPATGKGTWPTSSASALHIVMTMLEALDVRPGMKVLEIGTGTGYNAALLAELVGAENVTTVEIDAGLCEQARAALGRAGYGGVQVVHGDGADGVADNAPYDRVIATASVCELPYAWVRQTRPGGLILAPWGPTVHPDDPLAVLTVAEDGTAEGRFTVPSWFMPLRGQRQGQDVFASTRERWEALGRPDASRFGVTVTAAGQRVWMDAPV